jgi:lipopolysaccharide export system protein LptA
LRKILGFSLRLSLLLLHILAFNAHAAGEAVQINSDNLRIEERSGTVHFEGNVQVQLSEGVLSCDLLIVMTSKEDSSVVRKAEATGNVVLQRGQDRVQAGKAIFDLEKGNVELTGDPFLTRADSTITARSIAYSLDDGTASFEGPVKAVFSSPEHQ